MSIKTSPEPKWLRAAAVLSAPLATILLGAIGVYVTKQYNDGQLKVTRTREIALVIQQLSSSDDKVRLMASAILAAYGEPAVHPLIALLSSGDNQLSSAAAESLIQVGGPAETVLVSRYCVGQSPRLVQSNERGWILYVIGRLDSNKCDDFISRAINDNSEEAWVRVNAIEAASLRNNAEFIPDLANMASKGPELDKSLAQWVAWALGTFDKPSSAVDLLPLLKHGDPETRHWVYVSLAKLKDSSILSKVCEAAADEKSKNDSSQDLKDEAQKACGDEKPN